MRPEDEPSDEAASTPLPESAGAKRSRAFMKAARKDLSEEDLSTPAARRFLLDELERLDIEVSELQEFRSRYYEASTKISVLEERQIRSSATEIMSNLCLTVGSAMLGASPSLITATGNNDGILRHYGWVFFTFAALLVGVSVFVKAGWFSRLRVSKGPK
jgi:hypothetical protein